MAKVTVEVNSATNKVEKIYPFRAGVPVNPEPGRYAIPNVDDFIVSIGWICDPNTSPATFAPDPNPETAALSQSEAIEQALAEMAKATANMQAALALG